MSILLITHDLAVVKEYSDYIYVINQGKIVEQNTTEQLFENPQNQYTKLLLKNDITPNSFEYKDKKTILDIKNLNVKFPITKGIFKRVVDNFIAVNNVSFNIFEGECLGIIGESGSGKSTLSQAILKLVNSEGKISFLGNDLTNLDKKALQKLRVNMQIVFQDPFNSLNPRMSIFSIVSEGLDIHTNLTKEEKKMKWKKYLKL